MADNATDPRRSLKVWAVIGLILLLCCGGFVAATAYLYIKDERDMPGMRAAGEAYLAAVIRGEYRTAYDLLCERDRRAQQLATWQPTRGSTEPTGFRVTDVEITRPEGAGGLTLRTVTAEITRADYAPSEVEFRLEKQDGAWKVCSPPKL